MYNFRATLNTQREPFLFKREQHTHGERVFPVEYKTSSCYMYNHQNCMYTLQPGPQICLHPWLVEIGLAKQNILQSLLNLTLQPRKKGTSSRVFLAKINLTFAMFFIQLAPRMEKTSCS